MSAVTAWGPEEFRQSLAEKLPRVGKYGWMWAILRWRAQQTGWPPRTLYPLFRRFCNPSKPFFLGKMHDGLAFLGDYRDRYAVDHMVLPDDSDPLADFLLDCARKAEGDILDVGANTGFVSAHLARALPDRRVLAFEPMTETARRAAATFALNHLDNLTLVPAAVGAEDGELTFYEAPGHSDYASAHPTNTHLDIDWTESRVPCVTLDALRAHGIVGRVGVLKIDVEGHEFDVLRGAKSLIQSDRPHILLEYNRRIAPDLGWTPTDAAAFLSELATYRFHVLSEKAERLPFPPKENDVGIVNIYAEIGL